MSGITLARLMAAMACLAAIQMGASRVMAAQEAQVVFADHFGNGNPADSDDTPRFWSFAAADRASISETDGHLTMTAQGTGKMCSLGMRTDMASRFNFFERPLTFAVKVQMTGTAPSASQYLRFALTSRPGVMNYSSPDAVAVCYDGNHVLILSWKENAPGKAPEDRVAGHRLVSFRLPGPLSAFELTLDASKYKLVVNYQGGSKAFEGSHGIDEAQWGAVTNSLELPTHDSAIDLETLRIAAPDVSTKTVSTWESIVVTAAAGK